MKQHLIITIALLHTIISLGQRSVESKGAIEDFKIFKNILYKGHPALYDYTAQDSLDYVFKIVEDSLATTQTTDIELYKSLLYITEHIKDGHLNLYAPKTIKTEQYYFPLILKIISNQFYTDTDDFDIPIGSKIISINGHTTSEILRRLKKFAAVDGYNQTKKDRDIEQKFGLFFAYEYGISKTFQITYEEMDGIQKEISLEAESFAKSKLRNTKRRSYFAAYHKHEDGILFFDQYIGKKAPFVHYKPELKTAILVVNTFSVDPKMFQNRISKIFKQLKHKKIKNLILDLRNNTGGYRANAIYLYSCLAQKPFKQRSSEFVASLSIPERKHAIHVTLEDEQYLKAKFFRYPEIDGWKIRYDDMQIIMTPDPNHFSGKTYLLVGGNTFSSAAALALNAKQNPNIQLIGEETGGGYYFHCAEFPLTYEFPNSGIMMQMSMEKINHYIQDNTVEKGKGIPVDSYIPITRDHLVSGTDPQLDYALKLIQGNKR